MSRVLIACEFSGIVRESFSAMGHDAWSCDILQTEIPGNHIQGDVTQIIHDDWDLIIAHPPCTFLSVSGNRWRDLPGRKEKQEEAVSFFLKFTESKSLLCIENPVSIMSTKFRKPDQIIQPWQFGHGETKATCLWLTGLPKLIPTNIVSGRENRVHRLGPSKNRQKERSRTLKGIANAMAEQWGKLI